MLIIKVSNKNRKENAVWELMSVSYTHLDVYKRQRMEHTKDKDQKAPDTEREIIYSPMVAEPQEYKYNADAFAARKTSEAKQETAGKELPKVREDKAR